MTNLKGLFLGSAAAILAITGAQAADPPLETFDYVRICDAYGTNYYFIPGTETCLRIGGYTQWRATYQHENYRDRGFEQNADFNTTDFDFLGRARIWVDAREETEWGTLRAYYEGEANSNGSLNTRFAFLQIAGFTAGQAGTPMSFGIGGGPNYGTIAGDNGTSRGEMIYYTQPFGNGFSITIGAQESDTFDSNGGGGNNVRGIDIAGNVLGQGGGFFGGVTTGGDDAPDFVANMRFDDPGGLFSVGVAGTVRSVQSHSVEGTRVLNGTTFGGGFTDEEDEVGYAIRAGARVNLNFLGNGGSVGVLGTYSDGANNFAADYAPDAVLNTITNDLETVESWAVYGTMEVGLTPTLNMGIWGGYTEADEDDIWGHVTYAALAGTGNSIRQTTSWWNAGLSFTWSPINNLDIGLDVIYDHEEDTVLRENFVGVNALGEFDDSEDVWTVIVGATRTF